MRGNSFSFSGLLHNVLLSVWTLVLSNGVANGQVPVQMDGHARAQQALQAGDPATCLTELAALSDNQRNSSRNQWLNVQCLQASWEAKRTDERLAAACLVACDRYVRDFGGDQRSKGNVDSARKWLNGLQKHFGHDGLQYKNMRHLDLPIDQRQILADIEELLEQYDREQKYPKIEQDLQSYLDQLVDLDLPMPSGVAPFVHCLRHDAKAPFLTLMSYDRGQREDRINRLLLAAVSYDAPEITSNLLNEHFGERNKGIEVELLDVAVEKHANAVLLQWFNARTNNRIPGLNTWDQIAPRHATALAQAAITVGDTTFLRHTFSYGVDPDSLGTMVFHAIEGREPAILGILLDQNPPSESRDPAGLSYLHKAMALDSPGSLEELRKHDWFEKLADVLDPDGVPAVHYLVIRDLPNVFAMPDLLAHLDLNAVDQLGFTLLHKLIFRPADMTMSAESLLSILLKSNSKSLNKNKPGPYYAWTALHYAARENRPELVELLVRDPAINKAKKNVKDTWNRTPKDVATEQGLTKVVAKL